MGNEQRAFSIQWNIIRNGTSFTKIKFCEKPDVVDIVNSLIFIFTVFMLL